MASAKANDLGLCGTRLARVGDWMRGYVESGRLPCALTLVARRGEIALLDHCGYSDVETGREISRDAIFRIYSMTKPVAAVAAMMLYEEGRFQLDDPIARFLPEFEAMSVYVSGHGTMMHTEPAERPITVRDLLTHTAGFTYGFLDETPLGEYYRRQGIEFNPGKQPLAETVAALAELPLAHQPGARWNYGVSFDVLGRLIEIWSGQALDRCFDERIFQPLGMTDTAFSISDEKRDRLASLYRQADGGGIERVEPAAKTSYEDPVMLFSGGGGLLSTVDDFFRFTELLRRGGELDGVRLLGRKTVEFMTANHLGGDMADMGQPTFGESRFEGVGFGFGVSVMLDPARANIMGTPGEYAWGGAASTAFWIDPVEDMTVIFMTQLLPSSAYPLRRELRVLAYQALID